MPGAATHGTFDEAISKVDPHVQALAKRLRGLIVAVYPDVVEVSWPKQQIIGYGIGPKKMTEHFCYISVQSSYANLGFNFGVNLPDPDHLMEGSGKEFRHVKVYNEADAERPALRRLVEAAVKERALALGKNPP
jgi:hypothetical protein